MWRGGAGGECADSAVSGTLRLIVPSWSRARQHALPHACRDGRTRLYRSHYFSPLPTRFSGCAMSTFAIRCRSKHVQRGWWRCLHLVGVTVWPTHHHLLLPVLGSLLRP